MSRFHNVLRHPLRRPRIVRSDTTFEISPPQDSIKRNPAQPVRPIAKKGRPRSIGRILGQIVDRTSRNISLAAKRRPASYSAARSSVSKSSAVGRHGVVALEWSAMARVTVAAMCSRRNPISLIGVSSAAQHANLHFSSKPLEPNKRMGPTTVRRRQRKNIAIRRFGRSDA